MVTSELINIVNQYIQGAITLEDLEYWIAPRLPLFFRLPVSPTSEFVAGIELGLAEMSDGLLTEEEFRNMLRQLIQVETVQVTYPEKTDITVTASSNEASPSLIYAHSELAGAPSK